MAVDETKKVKTIGLMQISNSIGGSEIRMAKLALALAKDNRIKPVLIVNHELCEAYQSHPLASVLFKQESVEIRVISNSTLRPIRKLLAIWNVNIFLRVLLRIFMQRISMYIFRCQGLFAITKDLDVIHGFYGIESLAIVILASNKLSSMLIHEVTSHRVVNKYADILQLFSHANSKQVVLLCVSQTVQASLLKAVRGNAYKVLPSANISIKVSPGPFVGNLLETRQYVKRRKVVFGHRLQPSKNGILFALALRQIIHSKTFPDWQFCIFGRGSDEVSINNILLNEYGNSRVEIQWSNCLEHELIDSAIFVSIIETGNYPSQSVLEALGHGNVLVLSDTGLTKEKFGVVSGVTFYCNLVIDSLVNTISSAIIHIESVGLDKFVDPVFSHYRSIQNQSGYVKNLLSMYKL